MINRILFADNPWPNGHAIKELEWSARIDQQTGLWFDLHLVSDDYYAEDDDSQKDEDEESESDWASKIVWSNYHKCILSSTYWGHAGFLAATRNEPIDFASLGTRTFELDPLPPPEVPDDRAFGIYLLGHDGVADHRIQFTQLSDDRYALDWRGKIAMEYVGDDTFNKTFHAQYERLTFSGIQLPNGTVESDAPGIASRFVVSARTMKPTMRDGVTWLIPP